MAAGPALPHPSRSGRRPDGLLQEGPPLAPPPLQTRAWPLCRAAFAVTGLSWRRQTHSAGESRV